MPSHAHAERRLLPRAPDTFSWRVDPWGPTLVCRPLHAHAYHGWTTRAMRLEGADATCEAQWEALASTAGVHRPVIVRPRQVHGADVAIIDGADASLSPTADAVATRAHDVLLTVRVADCVPILLVDPQSGAIAAIHAGWRGTNAGIAQRTIERMHAAFGSEPADLIAAIGPSIGPCCYEVGPELPEAFRAAGWPQADGWFSRDAGLRLDLWRANRDQLEGAGVRAANVHVAGVCTACHPAVFYSYRRDGAGTGRLLGFIHVARASVQLTGSLTSTTERSSPPTGSQTKPC
jgi:YfiH family protein